jgi:hypothetical protein
VLPSCNPSQVRAIVDELNAEYGRAAPRVRIWEVAGGYQLRSLPEFAPYLRQIQTTRPLRLSPASLETLAVIAYRQPVTRAEIEHIRGVDCGRGAARPARPPARADRGPPRGAGPPDRLRHVAPLPRGVRARQARRSARAARDRSAPEGEATTHRTAPEPARAAVRGPDDADEDAELAPLVTH